MKTFWVFYVLAQTLHILAKCHFVCESKNSGISTFGQYFKVNWLPIIVRFCLATALFLWWIDDPTLVNRFFEKVGGMFSPGIVQSFITGVGFPLNVGTSFIYGIAADSILEKLVSLIPWLKHDIPSIKGETFEEEVNAAKQ